MFFSGRKMIRGKFKGFTLIGAVILCSAVAWASGISIRDWKVPSQGSFPHDPAVGPDGALWYTGMMSNTLGRVDPATGKIKEYPLPIAGSGPHGLVADGEGNIWFTASYKGYIGKLNAQTGVVTAYPMPDPSARDPHSLAIDPKGIIWFTVQFGSFVGRLDPRTGAVTLKQLQAADARPYGITVNSKGIPFFCEFGKNRIGRIDPATMDIGEYQLPKGARPRRLAAAQDDMIYFTDYRRGYIGRLNPVNGHVEEWLSPGGRDSEPYAVTVAPDGSVWYSETGSDQNVIVRFDPRKRRFVKRTLPFRGGVVRNLAATSRNEIYFACSGADAVGIALFQR